MLKRLFSIFIPLTIFSSLAYAYGPFDYTNPYHFRVKLPVVERHHFNSDVENLNVGMTGFVIDDLNYVLRTFPNHHRALNSMGRLWRESRKKNQYPPGASPEKTAEYYFEWAIKFAPQDGTSRMLYGIHLHASGKLKKALVLYLEAQELIPESAELHYNLGLLYLDMKDFKQARVHAIKAYNHDYPLQGLKNRLVKAGAWKS